MSIPLVWSSNGVAIGSNLTVKADVTLSLRVEPLLPMIGDDVILGTGCKVLGLCLLINAIIGANAVILSDIPKGRTAVRVPARLIDA